MGSGWLREHYWWGSVFFVNVPIATLAVVLVAVIVPTSRDPRILRVLGDIWSLFFRDPDGMELEVCAPAGGDDR